MPPVSDDFSTETPFETPVEISKADLISDPDSDLSTLDIVIKGEPSQGGTVELRPIGIQAQISVISAVAEGDRQHITLSNASADGFGISDYLFHLSDDPSLVGALSGTTITLERGVAKDLYLVGPSTAGVPGDGDVQHLSLIHISEPTRPY